MHIIASCSFRGSELYKGLCSQSTIIFIRYLQQSKIKFVEYFNINVMCH